MSGPAPVRRAGLGPVVALVAAVVVLVAVASLVVRGGVSRLPAAEALPAAAPSAGMTAPGVAPSPATALVGIAGPAAAHPAAGVVVGVLDRHFRAINGRDHEGWVGTVAADRSRALSRDAWLEAYRSTSDSAVEVGSIIDSAGGGVLVGLRFTSVQDPADAPADLPVARICWSVSWPVDQLAEGGRIGVPAAGTTERAAC